jgi:cell fate regulator YaaT (PSP1 superfamily)
MPDIVGVRFKKAGKVYYFSPGGIDLKALEYVVVQTARGMEIGQVTITPKQVLAAEATGELKPILRKASQEDLQRTRQFAEKEQAALAECNQLVAKLKLPMKLVAAEYNLDGGRLTFFFTAEARVDFRELVRELTALFKTRIELRQIGPRDQAKIIGGLGRCGRALCCASYLAEFNPVSIKMAKEQDLPLDPMKISGVCGRLQCCLAYEAAQYHDAKALLPRRGQSVNTPNGVGIVVGGNPLNETVLVEIEGQAAAEFPLSQLKFNREPTSQPRTSEPPRPSEQAETAPAREEAKETPPEAPVPAEKTSDALAPGQPPATTDSEAGQKPDPGQTS